MLRQTPPLPPTTTTLTVLGPDGFATAKKNMLSLTTCGQDQQKILKILTEFQCIHRFQEKTKNRAILSDSAFFSFGLEKNDPKFNFDLIRPTQLGDDRGFQFYKKKCQSLYMGPFCNYFL